MFFIYLVIMEINPQLYPLDDHENNSLTEHKLFNWLSSLRL